MRKFAVAALGVCLLFGAGTTGAVAGSLIGSKDIKNNSIRSVDIRDGGIGLKDLNTHVKARLAKAGTPGTNGTNGVDGATGPAGPAGPAGATGPAGPNGVSNYTIDGPTVLLGATAESGNVINVQPNPDGTYTVTTKAPTGTVVLGGGVKFDSGPSANFDLVASYPAADGSAWTVVVNATQGAAVQPFVVSATVN